MGSSSLAIIFPKSTSLEDLSREIACCQQGAGSEHQLGGAVGEAGPEGGREATPSTRMDGVKSQDRAQWHLTFKVTSQMGLDEFKGSGAACSVCPLCWRPAEEGVFEQFSKWGSLPLL